MKVLVLGAGGVGAKVIRQLRKNQEINIITADPRETPYALKEGIISNLDYMVELRSFELEPVIREIKPDLILVTTSPEDMGRSGIPGLDILVDALCRELETAFSVPVIAVSRTGIK